MNSKAEIYEIIDALAEMGFRPNIHGDASDRGCYRVYFDDGFCYVVKFNNPKTQLIDWKCQLDINMGTDAVARTIKAMMV